MKNIIKCHDGFSLTGNFKIKIGCFPKRYSIALTEKNKVNPNRSQSYGLYYIEGSEEMIQCSLLGLHFMNESIKYRVNSSIEIVFIQTYIRNAVVARMWIGQSSHNIYTTRGNGKGTRAHIWLEVVGR